jgi:microcystin-dependent protein
MSNPFLGEIRLVGFNFPPVGWEPCDGRLMAISENDALFALIGTTYGGDGQTTFALPDLRGRVPINQGQGPGLSVYTIGQLAGTESVTLLNIEMPQHTHQILTGAGGARSSSPTGNLLGSGEADIYSRSGSAVTIHPATISPSGGSQPHENMQPFLCVNFIICVAGIFPSRN